MIVEDSPSTSNAKNRRRSDGVDRDLDNTPDRIVERLDEFVIAQDDAKKAMAIALRSRWRQQQLADDIRSEVTPMNILMVGPTGTGKTEIARRLATMSGAPMAKVVATKFTEVGIHGTDAESMVSDLARQSLFLSTEQARAASESRSRAKAEAAVVKALRNVSEWDTGRYSDAELKQMLRRGDLDRIEISVDVPRNDNKGKKANLGNIFPDGAQMPPQLENMMKQAQQMMDQINTREQQRPRQSEKQKRTCTVEEALEQLTEQEMANSVDEDAVQREARVNAETKGIIFIDEIDKLAEEHSARSYNKGEGVQKELLALVEGTSVNTSIGPIKTDNVLFVCAGAFHKSKVSDLLPELQGRLPVRVNLAALTEKDLLRILQEPKHNLVEQTVAMMETEGLALHFTPCAIEEIASSAARMNEFVENIGARRLRTILAAVTNDISFSAPRMVMDDADVRENGFTIDKAYVKEKLKEYEVSSGTSTDDMSRYII